MRVGIYTNLLKDQGLEITKCLIGLLKNNKTEFFLYSNVKDYLPDEKYFFSDNYSFLNLMITIGGDGTVLNIVQDCLKYNIPMLTINKGTKGFLNEIELYEIERVIEIINGNYRIDKRQLISVTVGKKSFYALNEAYITRNSTGKMISLDVKIEDLLVERYFCDGLLIASATGSTAYSLSAGGPVISPKAGVMCLTPVCPHCLHSRPIIVDDKEYIQVLLGQNYDDAVLLIDGVLVSDIKSGDTVSVKKSRKSINFLRLKTTSFYSRLLDKLNGLV